jgi:folate-binding protein YgfZ
MSEAATVCLLEDIGALHLRGPDVQKFLQGQLSNDLARLAPGTLLRAGLHNPQGRTLALLWLAGRAGDDVLALLPRELASGIAAQLRRYLLRARLTLSDVSAQYRIYGLAGGAHRPVSSPAWLYDAAGRTLLIQDPAEATPPGEPMSREHWRALDVAAGLPQVYAATSAEFVAQMLNLDCIDAISFSKGCYTGQEVIARAHYRGRVKRRLQRFASASPLRLAPGDSGQLDDGRSFRVVEAVVHIDGSSEFLAVAPLPGTAREDAPAAAAATTTQQLHVTALPLPYTLPV